jgi:hypothetical protein
MFPTKKIETGRNVFTFLPLCFKLFFPLFFPTSCLRRCALPAISKHLNEMSAHQMSATPSVGQTAARQSTYFQNIQFVSVQIQSYFLPRRCSVVSSGSNAYVHT